MNYTIYESSIFNSAWNIIQSSAISLLFFWVILNIAALGTMYYFFKNNKKIKSVYFSNFLNCSIMTTLAAELFDAIKIHFIIKYYNEQKSDEDIDSKHLLCSKSFFEFNELQILCKLQEIFSSKNYFKFKLV